MNLRSQLLTRKHPSVFNSVLTSQTRFSYRLVRPSHDHSMNMYCAFLQNADPLGKIIFVQDLTKLRIQAIDKQEDTISDEDSALLLAIYLAGLRSMTEKECSFLLNGSKASLMAYYQGHLEALFAQLGIFCIENIKVMKAVMIYMVSDQLCEGCFRSC